MTELNRRERWGGAGLHRGGAAGVVRCRRRSEDALVARVHDVEEAEEEDEDVDVDDGVEAIRSSHPSESVGDEDGVQEDMSKTSLRPSGHENDDGRRWFISLLSVL